MARLMTLSGLVSVGVLAACQSPVLVEENAQTSAEVPIETASAPDASAELDVVVHDGDFAAIQQFTTPGGVSVWLVSEPSIPILSVNMSWEGGRAADPDGFEGLGNSVGYNMNEGAGDLDSLAFQTRMEDLNMGFGCSAGQDWTSCSATMLTDNADEAMGLIALAFAEPRFDPAPYERFKRETRVSLETRETRADYLASRAEAEALYPDHPYAREISEASLNALSPELAKAHMRRLMTKDRLLVTAVGAVTAEEFAVMIDAVAVALPETSELPITPDIALPDTVEEAVLQVDLPQPQSLVSFTGPGLKRDHPDFFTAYVLNYTFGGGGFESRLMKTLRIEKGLTYGVYSNLSFGDHLQSWGGSGQTKNESAGEFVEGIKDEMVKIVETGVSEQELADAKAYLIGSYPLGFDSNEKIADSLMGVRRQNLGVAYYDTRNSLIDAVTLEDVNRVAAEYLQPERYTFIVVGEPEGLN